MKIRNKRKFALRKLARKWRLRGLSKRVSTFWQGGFFYKTGENFEGDLLYKFREAKTHGIFKDRLERGDGLRWYTRSRIVEYQESVQCKLKQEEIKE